MNRKYCENVAFKDKSIDRFGFICFYAFNVSIFQSNICCLCATAKRFGNYPKNREEKKYEKREKKWIETMTDKYINFSAHSIWILKRQSVKVFRFWKKLRYLIFLFKITYSGPILYCRFIIWLWFDSYVPI